MLPLSGMSKTLGIHANISCIVDTGCINTLVPLIIAKKYGIPTNIRQGATISKKSYETRAYIFSNVLFGNMKVRKMIGFCADYEGELKETVLIGSNFLANIEYTISRNKNKITFIEDVYMPVRSKEYPYLLFFDNNTPNPVYPNNLLEATGEDLPRD
jgi:hypothetical protein